MTHHTPPATSENDPSIQVRTDLWQTMSVSQLGKQRELLLDKLSKIQLMIGEVANPSLQSMYSAIQLGLQDIEGMIDYRMAHKDDRIKPLPK